MTPDGDPFLCGTYYPRARFVQRVRAVSDAWRKNPEQIKTESQRISQSPAGNAAAMSIPDVAGDAPQCLLATSAGVCAMVRVIAASPGRTLSSLKTSRTGDGAPPVAVTRPPTKNTPNQ